MNAVDRPRLLGIKVHPDQFAYVEPMAETLATSALERENYVIDVAGDVVGFFQIDSSSGNQPVPDNPSLHEVQIDSTWQGRGYGRQFVCALRDFLIAQYPGRAAVCLTVNCRNMGAYRLYQLGGFVDTGELYLGGRSGPQHIMVMELT